MIKPKIPFDNLKIFLVLFLLLAVFSTAEGLLQTKYQKKNAKTIITHYNNYIVFKNSHFHLLEGENIYQEDWSKYSDFFRYSPFFAFFFGIFAFMNDIPGLLLWNILNALLLFFAIKSISNLENRIKGLILLAISIELLTSLKVEQSNPLIAGSFIMAFSFFEKEKYLPATFLIVFSSFIKVFGLVAFILILFYPKKLKIIVYGAMWAIIFLLLPLLITGFQNLVAQYKNWWQVISFDYVDHFGISFFGWLKSWFGINSRAGFVLVPAGILFILPFLRFKMFSSQVFRLYALSNLLIWVVIFNYKAESPTYIIAVCGVMLWYFTSDKSRINTAILILTLIFTCLSPSDIFPRHIRIDYFKPFVVKAVPCILAWFKITWDMLSLSSDDATPKPASLI